MKLRCPILFVLLFFTFTAPSVEAYFESQEDLYKHIYAAGYEYVVNVPFHTKLRIKLLNEDGTYTSRLVDQVIKDFDVEYLPDFNYKYKVILSFRRSEYIVRAYKVGETMVCYEDKYLSMMAGQYLPEEYFDHCLIFPYKVDQVLQGVLESKAALEEEGSE